MGSGLRGAESCTGGAGGGGGGGGGGGAGASATTWTVSASEARPSCWSRMKSSPVPHLDAGAGAGFEPGELEGHVVEVGRQRRRHVLADAVGDQGRRGARRRGRSVTVTPGRAAPDPSVTRPVSRPPCGRLGPGRGGGAPPKDRAATTQTSERAMAVITGTPGDDRPLYRRRHVAGCRAATRGSELASCVPAPVVAPRRPDPGRRATTRTRAGRSRPHAAPAGGRRRGRHQTAIPATPTGLADCLGEGGFGQVYLARRLGRARGVPAEVCVKVSARIDGWLREAYFGQLLAVAPAGDPRLRLLPGAAARRPDALRAWRSSTPRTAT